MAESDNMFTFSMETEGDQMPTVSVAYDTSMSSDSSQYERPLSVETASPERIITATVTEQVLTTALLTLFWIYVNTVNGFIVYVIRTTSSLLENCLYPVLICYILSDVLMCNLHMMVIIPLLIGNTVASLHHLVCSVIMCMFVAMLFTNLWMVGYMAFERYMYFIRPLRYMSYFTKNKIIIVNLCVYSFSFVMSLIFELIESRVVIATTMACGVAGPVTKISDAFYILLFWVPSGSMSLISVVNLGLLASKHRAQVDIQIPQEEDGAHTTHTTQPDIAAAIRRAIKMIILVSGSFWITSVPAVIVRESLLASGVTWMDTDGRSNVALFALSRGAYLLMTTVSSILNPIIYISLQNDLRKAVFMKLRINSE